MTVNLVSKLMHYAIPKIDATLAKGRVFTKLNFAKVYQQLKVNAKSIVLTHTKVFFITQGFPLVYHLHLEYFRSLV